MLFKCSMKMIWHYLILMFRRELSQADWLFTCNMDMTNILKKMLVLTWNTIEMERVLNGHIQEMMMAGLHRIFCCMLGKRMLTFSIAKLKRNLLKLMRIPLV